jgi:histidine triad (HIT) family protein/ATP adenylyltransferase
MDRVATDRVAMDLEAYVERVRSGPCFVCATLRGDPDHAHPVVYEDEVCAAFLSRYPTLLGYTLVVPRAHVRDVTGDRALFRHVTDVVHDVAEALKRVVATERVYLLSLGSAQGNAHVHWHVAALPPGVPYERQQYHALMTEHGVLAVTGEEQRALAGRLGEEVRRLRTTG